MMIINSLLFLLGTFGLLPANAIMPLVGVEIDSMHGPIMPLGANIKERPVETFVEYARSGSPFIKNFVQKGTNLFYKPQITLASGSVQPMVVGKKDCDELPLVPMPTPIFPQAVEEPIKIVENNLDGGIEQIIELKPWMVPAPVMPMPVLPMPVPGPVIIEEPAVIPELPMLPPLVLPEVPVPTVIEPVLQDEIIELKPILPMPIPEPIPVLVEEPEVIPEAPVLPPLTMPELPVPVIEVQPPVVPQVPMIPIPVFEEPEIIPEAPLLPPLTMPEFPVVSVPAIIEEPVIIPEAPIVPPLVLPEIIERPIMPMPSIVEEPAIIPEAPLLPPLTMPELPAPVLIEEHVISHDEEPLLIPSAPLLPPVAIPSLPEPQHPMFVPMPVVAPFPQVPVQPHMPLIHERVEIFDKVVMPLLPSSISFPATCAQEIIAERVLPNIVREQKMFVPTTYPVPSPFLYRH